MSLTATISKVESQKRTSGRITIAWKVKDEITETVEKYEGFIVPRSFRLFDGESTPYEFAFSQTKPSYDEEFQR